MYDDGDEEYVKYCDIDGFEHNIVLWYENLIKFSTQISPHALHSFSDIVMLWLAVFFAVGKK